MLMVQAAASTASLRIALSALALFGLDDIVFPFNRIFGPVTTGYGWSVSRSKDHGNCQFLQADGR